MKKLLVLLIILFSVSFSFAQEEELSEKEKARREKNIQAGNPFKRFGYTPKIATLSKGKYLEFHDLDSIVTIGSYSYHVKRKEITGYTKLDTVHPESTLRPEIISRWFSPDPLSDEFPSWSPYTFVYNNPVRFIDPDGRAAEDIIDIEKSTGVVTVTKAEGNDIVRSVDNGKVNSSYTYGENGSFNSDNTIVGSQKEGFQALISKDVSKSKKFYEFAANNSDVEFGRLEVSKDNTNISVVNSTFDHDKNEFLNEFTKSMANEGFTIIEHSHSHPGQEIGIPSGYYGIEKGNSNSLTPIPNNKNGDAEAVRIFSKYKQFNKAEFNIYSGKTKTIYNGVKKAKVVPTN
jgi:hypothetical protein